ncbi:hypothetical protein HDV00_009920 [Rhizophlyctis rosea]|nr:hypothetical protein HDV00_009920 [Rhizophlyctis rosea]
MATGVYATKFSNLITTLQSLQATVNEGLHNSTEAATDLEDSLHSLREISNASPSETPTTYTEGEYDDQTRALADTIPSYLERQAVLEASLNTLKDLKARLASGEGIGDPIAEVNHSFGEGRKSYQRTVAGDQDEREAALMKFDEYERFQRQIWEKRYPNTPFKEPKGKSKANASAADDSDDDIVITSQSESYLDPLTQTLLTQPVTSSDCGHSYSRASIMAYIGRAPHTECPVAGCKKFVRLADLQPNKRLERAVAQRRRQLEEEEEEEDEEYAVVE